MSSMFREQELILDPFVPRYLDLSNNDLSGSLPATFLGNSSVINQSLSILLSNNAITGSVPIELGRFENLDLELGGNEIWELPEELCENGKW
jgi:hypothetical protein